MSEPERVVDQQRIWEGWARSDPMWAILSDPDRKGGRWEPEEFFRSGVEEIDSVLSDLQQRGIDPHRGRALDFGCGVGRLTQALAEHFESADGVDIAQTMVALAQEHNRFGDRVRYHVNPRSDLSLFEDVAQVFFA